MTQSTKSPFYIIQDFISPLMCEEIIDQVSFTVPDTDAKGNPIACIRQEPEYEIFLYDRLQKHIADITKHYDITYKATTEILFHWYDIGAKQAPQCENGQFLNNKWVKVRDRDITCILMLSDFNDGSIQPFDDEYEVYGGKLEFPQHRFSFQAQRGTLIAFPSEPHFINAITSILAGGLYLAKFHIAAQTPFLYDPKKFPGDYTTWLKEFV